MSTKDFKGQPLIYAAARIAMDWLGKAPEGKYKLVDRLFNVLHDFYWTDCPCPANRPQRRGESTNGAQPA